ncbi:ammonium transporter [Candidatus Hydrogenedentota bacterium]
MIKKHCLVTLFLAVLTVAGSAYAQEEEGPAPALEVGLDTLWVLLAAFLVFFMQAGFGMVEAGFIRAKNACNILTKNFLDFALGCMMFFIVGYALMFGKGNGFIGASGFMLSGAENPSGVPLYAFWLFQAAFCGAAATIVAGGMAERMKFHSYLLYTVVVSAIVYPIVGHWIWSGEGWLATQGFGDFAGSTVVHATGGWIAFVGTWIMGPRLGKFVGAAREPKAIAGHSIPLAALGVFLLWFGWFGFNPGSTLSVGDGSTIALVAINTNLAACAGAVAAMTTVWLRYGKPDLSMTMNGALAGLVAITAPCAFVSPSASLVIGAVGGVIVVFGVALLDAIKVDDPVGAVPVHGMNGIWGTLAVGLWGQSELGLARDGLFHGGGLAQLGVQAVGAFTVAIFVMASMSVVFLLIKKTVGLRVSKDEERRGLDIGEHGLEAYSGFQIFTNQ